MGATRADVQVRRATPSDLDAAIEVAAEALGWDPDRPNEAFFRWKHLDNPFGPSPMWLAEVDGHLAGFRTFLRWRFRRPDGSMATAVRAVDTATLPGYQGLGVFRTLTLQALDELRDDGVDFVYNTPNDQSRPGYLKMGWHQVGRVPVRARLVSLRSLRRVASARAAAQKWSEPVPGVDAAADVLADRDAVADLLAAVPTPAGYATDRTPEYLRWRYRFAPLVYRAIAVDADPRRGLAVFRVRRRGGALETTVTELLVPGGEREATVRLLRQVRLAAPSDFVLYAGPPLPWQAGFVPVPGVGPILTWRALVQDDGPPLASWTLGLGDVELF